MTDSSATKLGSEQGTAGEWTYMPFGVVGWIKDPTGKPRVSIRSTDKEMREILLRLLNTGVNR